MTEDGTEEDRRARRSSNGEVAEGDERARTRPKVRGRARQRPAERRLGPPEAARRAAQAVAELTSHDPEAVISIERCDEGWKIGVEVVETHRIPDSADILASYEAMKGRGVTFRFAPRVVTTDGKARDFYVTDFRDPDGHVLSIGGWIPHRQDQP